MITDGVSWFFFTLCTFWLFIIFMSDLVERKIPNWATLLPIPVVLGMIWQASPEWLLSNRGSPVLMALTGGLIAFTALMLLNIAFWLVFRAELVGWGDVKLAALLGIMLGPYLVAIAIWAGFCLATLFLLGKRRLKRGSVPLGSCFCVAAVVAMLFAERIMLLWE